MSPSSFASFRFSADRSVVFCGFDAFRISAASSRFRLAGVSYFCRLFATNMVSSPSST